MQEGALGAEVLEVSVERGKDILDGLEAAPAGGVIDFELQEAGRQLAFALAGASELLAEAAVLALGGDDGTDQDGGTEGRGCFGVGGDRRGIGFHQIGVPGAEGAEGVLEAFDIIADLADEALGACIGAIELTAKGERGRGGRLAGGCGNGRGRTHRGERDWGGRARAAGFGLLLPAQRKAHVRSPVHQSSTGNIRPYPRFQ